MTVGILKEPSHETRVSLLPEAVAQLTKKGISVLVESGAGVRASATDDDYEKSGAKVSTAQDIVSSSDVILSINQPSLPVPSSRVLMGVYQPLYNQPVMQQWAQQGLTVFSLDMLPRTTRAQSMDILSSQANISGYKAVVEAASHFERYL